MAAGLGGTVHANSADRLAVALRYFVTFLFGFVTAMVLAIALLPPKSAVDPTRPVAEQQSQPREVGPSPDAIADLTKQAGPEVEAAKKPHTEATKPAAVYRSPIADPDAPIDPTLISSDRYANMDRLTTYSVLVGRGIGCQIETRDLARRVYQWLLIVTEGREGDRDTMTMVWHEGQRQNAYAQFEGRSPEDCDDVARGIQGHRWP